MPRTYRKNIVRTLKSSRGRFLSIFSIVTLGVGFLAGLNASPLDMKESMERYMDDANFYDLRVVSSMGLSDGDVEALQAVEGVRSVQPGYSADLLVNAGEDILVTRLLSLPPDGEDTVNRLFLEEGRLPQKSGECVIEANASLMGSGCTVGTQLTVSADNEDLDTTLACTEYTVVGVVHNANYCSFEREPASVGNGTVNLVMYLRPEDFAYEAYTEVYLTVDGAREADSMEDAYDAVVAPIQDKVEALEPARAQARYDEIRSEAQAEIDDAWAEYYDAEAEAQQELADAAQELADGRQELADGEQEYLDGEQEYADGAAELADNEALVNDGAAQLQDGRQQLLDAQAEYEDGVAQLADGERLLADGYAQLEAAQKQYDDGVKQYEDGVAQFEAGKQQYEAGLAQYEAGKKEYDDGLAQYQAGEEQYAQLAQLNQAYNGVQAGIRLILDSGQAATEEEARALFSDETIARLEQMQQLAALYDAKTAAYDAWQEALRQAGQEDGEEDETPPVEGKTLPAGDEETPPAEGKTQPAGDEETPAAEGETQPAGDEETPLAEGETQPAGDEETLPAEGETPPVEDEETLSETKAGEAVLATAQADAAARAGHEQPAPATLEPAALPQADEPPQAPDETQTPEGEPDPDAPQEPETPQTPTEEEIAALEAAYRNADMVWRLALQAAAAQMGMQLDIENPMMVAMAEKFIVPLIDEARPGIAQLDQLKLLNTAQKGVEAGVAAMIESGAAANEAEAIALFSDEGLAAVRAQLDEAKALLDENAPVLEAARQELEAAAKTIAEGEQQLADAKAQLDAGKAELDDGWAQYYEQKQVFEDGKAQLEDGKRQLDEGWATLTDRQIELDDARRQIADAKQELADARAELDDARQTIAENKQKLLDGEIEYEDAKAEAEQELADARAEIEDAQQEIDDIEMPEWYVWDRGDNVSYASFTGNIDKLSAITTIFPVFFFLVAALVVSTTMTRMVEEERLQIGTLKALGYTRGEIMRKYLWYALAAALSGTAVGLTAGFQVFPSIIWSAYATMYYMPSMATPWRALQALYAGGTLTVLTVGVTALSCRASLAEVPAALMLPRAPKAGKRIILERIGPLWRRLPFSWKVTCRNLLRYKKRFWMTVLGVMGCTSLLVAGFGISDSLNAIITRQYGEVSHYDLMTIVTEEGAVETGPVYDYLFTGDAAAESMAISMETTRQDGPEGGMDIYLMIPRDVARFADFVDLHERVSRTPTPLGESGIVITEKMAKTLGVAAGDTLTLENADGDTGQFAVTGVCEHYISNYVYMSAATYEAGFGKAPAYNAILSILADDSESAQDAISTDLLDMDKVASLSFTQDNIVQVLNMLNSIDAVVVLIIICAAGLAFVVLYNLSSINVAERVKEIATIKVLGFYDREVNAYVNRESVLLTLIGTLFGLAGGIALHRFIIVTVEVDAVMFGRDVAPLSFVYAVALTLLFSTIVNLVMQRSLKKISMVESMKAPE